MKEIFQNNFLDINKDEKKIISIFSEGEVFDAQEELKNLKNYHGEDGLKKLKEFKERLRFQKIGLAKIESKILDCLENNTNFGEKELFGLIADDIKKFALNDNQIKALENVIKDLFLKNKNINLLVSDCKDEGGKVAGEKVYEKLFGKKPEGKISLIINSYCIYFCPDDNRDFCYVVSGAYKKHRSLNKKDMEHSRTDGGVKLDSYPRKRLNGLIAIQNADFFENPNISDSIIAHERKHVINKIIAQNFNMPENDEIFRKYENLKKENKIKNKTQEEEFILLSSENLDIEKRIKDEICAYFKGGATSKKISKMILGEGTLYDYGYNYNLGDGDEFDLEYLNLVEDAIISFSEFLNRGYQVDEIISFLLPEPINKWPKILKRITGLNIGFDDWQKKKEKYISQKILTRDSLLEISN